MAVRTATNLGSGDYNYVVYQWTGLLNGDTGAPAKVAASINILAQLTSGTLGAGGACTWQGTLDPAATTGWFTLSDTAVAAIVQTALGQKMALETPLFIRPNITAGDGTTALVATAACQFFNRT